MAGPLRSAAAGALRLEEERVDALLLTALALLNLWAVFFLFRCAMTGIANTGDEYSQLFQARIFSGFRWTAPAPPMAELFASDYITVRDGRWFSIYPPLYPMLLALGLLLGSAQITAALLSTAALVLVFLVAREGYRDRALAWATTGLLFVSPSFRFYSASYYNHLGSLVSVLVVVLAAQRLLRPGAGRGPWLCAGLAACAGVAIRPFEVVVALAPFAGAVLWTSRRQGGSRESFNRLLLSVILLAAAAAAALVLANGLLTDSDYLRVVNSGGKLGLWRNLRWSGLERLWDMLDDTAKWLFAYGLFASPNLKDASPGDWNLSLPLLLAGLAYGAYEAKTDRTLRRTHVLLLALAAGAVLGHLFYDKQHGRFGERRFFEAGFVFCLFTSRLLLSAARRASRRWRWAPFLVLAGANVSFYLPATAEAIAASTEHRMTPYLSLERLGIRNALVFMRSAPDLYPRFYARNDPDMKGNIIAIPSERDPEVVRLLPGRPCFVFRFDWTRGSYVLERCKAGVP